MNAYRNKKTGVIIEIASEFGNAEVWEKISPTPAQPVKAEPVEEPKKEVKKTTTKAPVKKAVKK